MTGPGGASPGAARSCGRLVFCRLALTRFSIWPAAAVGNPTAIRLLRANGLGVTTNMEIVSIGWRVAWERLGGLGGHFGAIPAGSPNLQVSSAFWITIIFQINLDHLRSLTSLETNKFPIEARPLRPMGFPMARSNLAMHTETVMRRDQRNVVPFDNDRRRLHLEHSSGGESQPRGVVRLPLPAGRRALERGTDAQNTSSDSNGDALTPIEYIVAFLLFLSTLTGPALVWTLLSL